MLQKYVLVGAGANKVPQNADLKAIIIHSFCSANAMKWEVLRPKFLEPQNGSCGLKTPKVAVYVRGAEAGPVNASVAQRHKSLLALHQWLSWMSGERFPF